MASQEGQPVTKDTKPTTAASTGLRRSHPGQGAATGARLPSIKKRDLTLGGAKKTFTPNIPAQRVKKEDMSSGVVKKEPIVSNPSPRGKEKQQKEGWSGKEKEKGRGRGRGREIITSSSVFSMGPVARKGTGVGGVPTGGGVSRSALSSSSNIGGVGRAKVGGVKLSPSSSMEMSAFQAPAEHMDVDGSDSESELFAHSAYPPIQLPLDYTQHQKKHRTVTTAGGKVVTSSTPKVEMPDTKPVTVDTKAVLPDDTSMSERKTSDISTADVTYKSGDKCHPALVTSTVQPSSMSASEVTAAEVLSHSDDPQAHMVLLQLPDTLPFTAGDQMEEGGEGAEETNSEEKLVSLSASQHSGYVGKLKVHKSGKVKLHLGNTVLDVSMGTPCSFRQDVVSMDTAEGNLIHLGVLSHKFVCIPDFEHLLSDVASGSTETM